MNHQQVLKSALAGLPAERAGYFTDLGLFIEEKSNFDAHRHWMIMLLASGCELIPPVIEKEQMAAQLLQFVRKRLISIQKAAYSRDFILKKGAPMAELATEFASEVSDIALDAYRAGKIESDEPVLHVFRWPYTDDAAFPYSEDALYDEDDSA